MSSSKLTVEVWPVSEAGHAGENEDYVLFYQPANVEQARYSGSLYVVADGFGGGARGKMASRYAAQKVMHAYYNSDEPDLGLRLRLAVEAANADLYQYVALRPELVKTGSTMVVAAVRGEQVHIASVGDSRAYLVRDGAIQQITRDHTLVQQLVDEGALSPDEVSEHPRRDVVLRMLGAAETVSIDIFDLRLRPDDALVLCTDGVNRHLFDEEIAEIVASSSPRTAAETLAQKAIDRGGKDDITVLATLLRDGAPASLEDVPYQWDGQLPSFDEQPTLAVPRVELTPEDTIQAERPALDEVEAQPAPAYEQVVKPAPSYTPPPPQPVQQGGEYGIDPTTGLPPVPVRPTEQPAQPAGYQPRVYKPQTPVSAPPRRGVSMGAFAAVGALAVLMTALMVLILVNPFNWSLPSGILSSATESLAEETPVADQGESVVPTATVAVAEETLEPTTPEPTQELEPTAAPAPPNMVLVSAGAFLRGVSDDEAEAATLSCINDTDEEDNVLCYPEYFSDAQPVEEVTLSAFYMDVTEVTNAAYTDCVLAGVCTAPSNTEFYADPAYAQHPVVYVDYEQATTYCNWLGKRLPTEAEWEKAARWDPATGESYWYPWGNEWEAGRANTVAAGLEGLSAVQAFSRDLSPSGLLGMAGNASEWVQDWYFDSYDGLGTLNPARLGSQPLPEPFRVARGGNFQSLAVFARSGHRYDMPEDTGASWVSFRCAVGVNEVIGTEEAPAEEAPAEEEVPVEGEETPATDETPTP